MTVHFHSNRGLGDFDKDYKDSAGPKGEKNGGRVRLSLAFMSLRRGQGTLRSGFRRILISGWLGHHLFWFGENAGISFYLENISPASNVFGVIMDFIPVGVRRHSYSVGDDVSGPAALLHDRSRPDCSSSSSQGNGYQILGPCSFYIIRCNLYLICKKSMNNLLSMYLLLLMPGCF